MQSLLRERMNHIDVNIKNDTSRLTEFEALVYGNLKMTSGDIGRSYLDFDALCLRACQGRGVVKKTIIDLYRKGFVGLKTVDYFKDIENER